VGRRSIAGLDFGFREMRRARLPLWRGVKPRRTASPISYSAPEFWLHPGAIWIPAKGLPSPVATKLHEAFQVGGFNTDGKPCCEAFREHRNLSRRRFAWLKRMGPENLASAFCVRVILNPYLQPARRFFPKCAASCRVQAVPGTNFPPPTVATKWSGSDRNLLRRICKAEREIRRLAQDVSAVEVAL